LLAAALAASSAPAWGQTTAARLEVEAQPSCSTRDELIARVAARSARIRFVDGGAGVPVMTARIDAGAKGAVVAELTVVEPDGRRFARRLEAPSCAAATDALALVVAITLDPSAATAEAAAPSDAVPSQGTAAGGAAAAPPASPLPTDDHPTINREAPAPESEPTRRLTVGAAGALIAGPAPTVMPGIALEAQAALDRASVWSPAAILTLAHVWSRALPETGGTAEFALDLLGLDLCPLRLALGGLEMRACGAGSVGRLAAQGSNTYDPRSVARPFATAGGTVRLAWAFGSRVEARARFGGGATLWRDAFEFSPGVFHRVASVTLVGDLGIGVRFP